MKKIILAISIALAVMSLSSCIILRDIPDTSYSSTETTQKSKPNRPSGSDTTTSKPSRPGNSTTSKSKPNRP